MSMRHIPACERGCVPPVLQPEAAAITSSRGQPFLLRNFADWFAESALIFGGLNLQFFRRLPLRLPRCTRFAFFVECKFRAVR